MTTYGTASKVTKGHGGAKIDAVFSEYTGIPIDKMDMKRPLTRRS